MKIGKRIIKSTIAVLISFVIYLLRGSVGMPFYTAIAALQCMQPYKTSTRKMGISRANGTLIGALFGLIVKLIEVYLLQANSAVLYYIIVSLATGALLYTTMLLKWKNISYFSCVVFLSVTVVHMGDANVFAFVWGRVVDTMIGIAVGLAVNSFEIPRKINKNLLLVSGLDGTLFTIGNSLSDYSKILLNRMIEDGAQFTISSARTPGAVVEATEGIKLKHPIIAMDGAVLYDIADKRYVDYYTIDSDLVDEIREFLANHDFHYFINGLLENVLLIYHGQFKNKVENDVYSKCRISPFRNYLGYEYYDPRVKVIYFMFVEETAKLEKLYDALKASPINDKAKILFYPSTDYPGYSYLKIFHKDASKKNMLERYVKTLPGYKSVTCGSIEGAYDIYMPENNPNQAVRKLYRIFKPYFWEKSEYSISSNTSSKQ